MKAEAPSMVGTVVTIRRSQGFAFVRAENGEDLFLHFSALHTKWWRALRVGDQLEIEAHAPVPPRGPRAKRARVIKKTQGD